MSTHPMRPFSNSEIYHAMAALVASIAQGAPDAMAQFGIRPPIYEEILEVLDSSEQAPDTLCMPPYDLAFTPGQAGRIPVDVVEQTYATAPTWRVFVLLWAGARQTELTLAAELVDVKGISLKFLLLEVQ